MADGLPVVEYCREVLPEHEQHPGPGGDRCQQQAEFILWGKLLKPDALGPRCYDHAAKHVGHRALARDSGWAIFDLRGLRRDDPAVRRKADACRSDRP